MNDKVIHATDADFDANVLNSAEPVLVDFWATWCGPCKMIAPALDELAVSYAGRAKVVKIDIDQNRTTAMKYHVRSIPTLLLFKDGQVQATQIGAVGKAQLATTIPTGRARRPAKWGGVNEILRLRLPPPHRGASFRLARREFRRRTLLKSPGF